MGSASTNRIGLLCCERRAAIHGTSRREKVLDSGQVYVDIVEKAQNAGEPMRVVKLLADQAKVHKNYFDKDAVRKDLEGDLRRWPQMDSRHTTLRVRIERIRRILHLRSRHDSVARWHDGPRARGLSVALPLRTVQVHSLRGARHHGPLVGPLLIGPSKRNARISFSESLHRSSATKPCRQVPHGRIDRHAPPTRGFCER